jgi:hypothetical protein
MSSSQQEKALYNLAIPGLLILKSSNKISYFSFEHLLATFVWSMD